MSSTQTISLVWFRRDLRLNDSEIVAQATANGQQVLPLFVIDSWFYQQPEISRARVKFLFECLADLDLNLKAKDSRLYLFEGRSLEVIKNLTQALVEQNLQPKLYFHCDVQIDYGIDRDRQILDYYQQHNLETQIGLNHFFQQSENYDSWWSDYHRYQRQPLYPTPKKINTPVLNLNLPQLTIAELKQKYLAPSVVSYRYLGGESFAQKTLASFVSHRYQGYHWKMSRPWQAQQGATSHLSAHLDFGTISARTVYQAVSKPLAQLPSKSQAQYSIKTFLDRLRWHNKFTQRHYHHPELAWQNRYPEFNEWYDASELTGEKQELFTAWCTGSTGYPLVDASMRQLNQMGWMNFRMRAMCVTFLTINCGVSWHHGARYFMSRLVDGNIAINHWQWQAQAGSLNPMSKTFRIYNPTKNLQEKDPTLQFVYCWIPQLRGRSMSQLLAGEYLSDYPQPILDWKQTRKVNGKVVSNLRKEVRERLAREQGVEYFQAIGARNTIDKYFAVKDRQYKE
ncbi:MAG: FAD-binding domain-containing protein, partial [Cyanobacteria bacterium J06600_6]